MLFAALTEWHASLLSNVNAIRKKSRFARLLAAWAAFMVAIWLGVFPLKLAAQEAEPLPSPEEIAADSTYKNQIRWNE